MKNRRVDWFKDWENQIEDEYQLLEIRKKKFLRSEKTLEKEKALAKPSDKHKTIKNYLL